jgi:DNA helicase HerA-like ATPase
VTSLDRLALPGLAGAIHKTTADQALRFTSEIPELLVSLLERRYLSNFQPAMWQISVAADDGTRPLLREVLSMGRQRPGEDWSQAMPHVLTATHTLGQAIVMAVHGNTQRHHIYLGGRRLSRPAQGSTEDFIEGQGSVLQAHIPGLRLGAPARLDSEPMSELSEFLRSAPALAVMTGVPSARTTAGSAVFQNLDRLISAAGSRCYAMIILAEPLESAELDRTIDQCRRLKGEVHALVRRTVSQTVSEGESRSTSTPDEHTTNLDAVLPAALYGLAIFCSVAGMAPGANALMQLASPTMLGGGISRQLHGTSRGSTTAGTTTSRAESGTAELLDANAEACELLLQRHIDRLDTARSHGWWRTSVFVAAENDATLQSVTGALRGMASGATSGLDTMRVIRPAPHLIRTAVTRGLPLSLEPLDQRASHPLGELYNALATCMTSDELSVLVMPPRKDVPGLPLHDIGEFALSAPPPTERSIQLGHLQDSFGRALGPVSLTAESLNRHVLINGMTGFGKTTTAKRLLLESYNRLGLPFLVIEPVKAEYRRLASHAVLRDRLRIYTIGDDGGHPLRLNPFVPVEDVSLLRHVDLLKAVFNASFPMFAGMSYVLEEAMLEIYTERGWNLHTSMNDLLGTTPSSEDISALTPSIVDLHDKIEQVLESKQYGREIHQNMGAALRSRLRSLMVGTKGMTLNTKTSVPARELFTQPCVIELKNLGDDEEKAFVMALLLCQLYEFAEARQADAGQHLDENLQHLTLIEEAHRLLKPARAPSSPESPESQAKAVTMFTDMLAEMRAYGEGFIVADQIPTKLAPEILKNSSVKILHRLVAPDDRSVVASAVNLNDAQNRHLSNLHPGVAVVHDNQLGSAVLVQISPLITEPITDRAPAVSQSGDLTYLHRNAACRHCTAPCMQLDPTRRVIAQPELDGQLGPLFQAVLVGDIQDAWRMWNAWRTEWLKRAKQRVPTAASASGLYCAASQASDRWVQRTLRTRDTARSTHGVDAEQLLVHSRCSRILGKLCSAWIKSDALDDGAEHTFHDVHQTLAARLAARPPRELPGCAECPVRCQMLPIVAPLLEHDSLHMTVKARATANTSPQARARSLATIPDPQFKNTLNNLQDPKRRYALLYCAVTNATADIESNPVELLAVLRAEHTEPPQQDE